MPKILLIHPLTKKSPKVGEEISIPGAPPRKTGDDYENAFVNLAQKVCRPDTEMTHWFVPKQSGSATNLFFWSVKSLGVINRIFDAEEEGYDAVIVGGHSDPGVQIARSVFDIPVVGPFESCLAMGHFIGERMGMITVRQQYVGVCYENIRRFGLQNKFITEHPIRYPKGNIWDLMSAAQKSEQPATDQFFEALDKLAMGLIDDGADTILCPGFPVGPALILNGHTTVGDTGVPYVDGASACFKFAEMLADQKKNAGLVRTKMQASQYQGIDKKHVERVLKEFGFRD